MIYYFIEKETIDDEYSWITVWYQYGAGGKYRFKGILDKEYAVGEEIHLKETYEMAFRGNFAHIIFEVKPKAEFIIEEINELADKLKSLIGAQKSPSSISKIQAETKFVINKLKEIEK